MVEERWQLPFHRVLHHQNSSSPDKLCILTLICKIMVHSREHMHSAPFYKKEYYYLLILLKGARYNVQNMEQ